MKKNKNALTYFSYFFILIFISSGLNFTKKENNNVKISIEAPDYKDAKIKITAFNIISMEQSNLLESKLDVNGKSKIEFELVKPKFLILLINGQITTLYLEPNDNLHLKIPKNIDILIQFTGVGAEANNYLANMYLMSRKIEQANGKSIYDSDESVVLHRLDSLQHTLANFHKNYFARTKLPKHINKLFEKLNTCQILKLKQICGWNRAVQSNPFKIPTALDINNQIPMDSELLEVEMIEYFGLFPTFFHSQFLIPFWESHKGNTPEENEKLQNQSPMLIQEIIKKTTYPLLMKEFLYAKNIDYWLGRFGITPEVDKLYAKFKNEFPKSNYLPLLDKHYKKWLQFLPGQPAPDFNGLTSDNKKVSLSDLKGKIVFIDVWATWCAPCVKELPETKEIQKKFFENKEVVFLYVSVDRNTEAWKKAIAEENTDNGMHINNDESIYQAYLIHGIPRYMLIDKEGKIVKVNAPWPSSGEVENEINQVLKRK